MDDLKAMLERERWEQHQRARRATSVQGPITTQEAVMQTVAAKFEAKVVTGRDENGTTYDEASTRSFDTLDAAATAVAQSTGGHTWDVFDPSGERLARVHVDGGIDGC